MSATDKNGNTALHHAATNLNFVATRVLIEAGSPLEVKNKDVSLMSPQSVDIPMQRTPLI